MKRVSLAQWAEMNGIKTLIAANSKFKNKKIPNAIFDPVTKSRFVLVPEYEGDTQISDELKKEIDIITNPERITLREFASRLGVQYKTCYSMYYLKGLIKNAFHDEVNNKITVLKTPDMFEGLEFNTEPLYPRKDVATFLNTTPYIIKNLVQSGEFAKDESGFSRENILNFIKNKKNEVNNILKEINGDKVFTISQASKILKVPEKTLLRWCKEKVIDSDRDDNGVIRIDANILKNHFINSGYYVLENRIYELTDQEIESFFNSYSDKDDSVKLVKPSIDELKKMQRLSLSAFAKKNPNRSYFSYLDDFYNKKLPNATQDEIGQGIFVLVPENKKTIIDPDYLHEVFNAVKRVSLVNWARSNNLHYNKAKTMAMKGEIEGALFDKVCNAFFVKTDLNDLNDFPYIRLDSEEYQNTKHITDNKEVSLYAFYFNNGLTLPYIKEEIAKGVISPVRLDGSKMYFSQSDIDQFFKNRKQIAIKINALLKEKSEFTEQEMLFMLNRDLNFLKVTAVRKKWLPNKSGGELFTKDEFVNFLVKNDNYWNLSEKEIILNGV